MKQKLKDLFAAFFLGGVATIVILWGVVVVSWPFIVVFIGLHFLIKLW